MVETVEARALKIAAKIMRRGGMCLFNYFEQCKRYDKNSREICYKCLEDWLKMKAREELKAEKEG